ncbi:MAG: hypothetical protein WCK28_19300 [Burkholderiales bacterium]|jgi:uncharacterized membrane protein YhaH (DUF805 family)
MSLLDQWIAALRGLVETPSIWTVLVLVPLVVPMWMIGRVLRRAGFSPWWVLLVLVPPVSIVALWVFAYVRWPSIDGPGSKRA